MKNAGEPPKLTVVVPYYQRAQGVLARALRSVARQDYRGAVVVLVVDDESPVSAKSELELSPDISKSLQIRLIERMNGGPGAARNAALEVCPEGAQYVAFLDSDDEWAECHLSNAVSALEMGGDVYFSDHLQLGQDIGAFSRGRRINLDDHSRIAEAPPLFRYEGDMFDQIIRGNLIGTSTVVYRFSRFSDLRFKEEYRRAGEDYLFWMELAVRGAQFCFSTAIEARYGSGVNVYSGAGWGTEGYMLRLHNEIRYKRATLELFSLSREQEAVVKRQLTSLRRAFCSDVIHRLRHRRRMDMALIAAHLRMDIRTVTELPAQLGRLVWQKARGKQRTGAPSP